jgi:hypothetical protein
LRGSAHKVDRIGRGQMYEVDRRAATSSSSKGALDRDDLGLLGTRTRERLSWACIQLPYGAADDVVGFGMDEDPHPEPMSFVQQGKELLVVDHE